MTIKSLNLKSTHATILLVAIATLTFITIACTDDDIEPTPYDREDFTALDGPPPFPIIFGGKFTVNGNPGPADQTIYAEFIHGGSPLSTTFEGEYVQVILGPVSNADIEHGVISFYLGSRDGDHVKAKETWIWDQVNVPTNQLLDLTFSRLPES